MLRSEHPTEYRGTAVGRRPEVRFEPEYYLGGESEIVLNVIVGTYSFSDC